MGVIISSVPYKSQLDPDAGDFRKVEALTVDGDAKAMCLFANGDVAIVE